MTTPAHVYVQVLLDAAARFRIAASAEVAADVIGKDGEMFHVEVPVLESRLEELWTKAIDALAASVVTKGSRRVFRQLDKPIGVIFAGTRGALRLTVQWIPPRVTDEGELIPEITEARFDCAGIYYQ
jgi:hypothetical protein